MRFHHKSKCILYFAAFFRIKKLIKMEEMALIAFCYHIMPG